MWSLRYWNGISGGTNLGTVISGKRGLVSVGDKTQLTGILSGKNLATCMLAPHSNNGLVTGFSEDPVTAVSGNNTFGRSMLVPTEIGFLEKYRWQSSYRCFGNRYAGPAFKRCFGTSISRNVNTSFWAGTTLGTGMLALHSKEVLMKIKFNHVLQEAIIWGQISRFDIQTMPWGQLWVDIKLRVFSVAITWGSYACSTFNWTLRTKYR